MSFHRFALPAGVARTARRAALVLLGAAGSAAVPAFAQNEIVTENLLPGNPPSEWDVTGAGDESIQGFPTDISVDQGGSIDFKVKTDATSYRIDIYRIGYYQGNGARLVDSIVPSAALPQVQPACAYDPGTRLLDCGVWAVSATWNVPPGATSGVYVAKLVRTDPEDGRASHVLFVVRDDDGASDLLMQTSDATWQAYNQYSDTGFTDGSSLYPSPGGKADKVSYNRPITTRETPTEDWFFNAAYPMIRWLERNGYDVSYFTGVDAARSGPEIQEHAVFLSVGHDEYWSREARDNVEAARDAGVHLAFFSGNEIYWKTRWEDSIDGATTPFRTMVCYKEGTLGENQCGGKCDPDPNVWTGLWRSGCSWTPPADGCEPENALSGQISWVGSTGAIEVPDTYARMPFWRNTSVAGLGAGQTATLPYGTLGYEWDFEQYEDSYPSGRLKLSSTTLGGQTHHLSLYRHPASGALVFGAGSVQWSWGLDSNHDRGSDPEDDRMQQATVNLFADMGVVPETLQGNLVAASASTDVDAPTSTIVSPTGGANVESGSPVTVSGTASDAGGGVVVLVEVSDDGGATWNAATGFENWSYTWTPGAPGSATLLSRAYDGTLNRETPGAGTPVTIESRTCPCSIWSDATIPVNGEVNDPAAVELGMKFRVDEDGYVTAVRFYKGAGNTGTHVGNLWDAGGTLLGTTTFQAETASGWQEESFGAPIAVLANTTYVVSYFAPNGNYAADSPFFSPDGVDNPPLHALADGVDGPNGVYAYGAVGSFPTSTFNSSNYYVDPVFDVTAVDTLPPGVASHVPASGAIAVSAGTNVTASFDEPVQEASIVFELRDPLAAPVPGTVTYDAPSRTATFDPDLDLDPASLYEATVDGALDLAGNAMAAPEVWTFTTAAPPGPGPGDGPGGPILVVWSSSNPFSLYANEILRAEGFNEFTVAELGTVDGTLLADHDVVILGDVALGASQVTMFGDWVTAGGNLIAFRPDPQLAPLLGLTDAGGTLSEGYALVETGSGPGVGIVGQTMQFHGTADLYTVDTATIVATLYDDATTPTAYPAVTVNSVGGNGGQAAAFTYDLARSVVYTRQGNPAWSGQERDGTTPIRSDDLFFGNAAGDPQPDWCDLDKVAIPQADEQQRLLANLMLSMNADRSPLPRFWYFPDGHKAVVVMTGDDHNGVGTTGRFDIHLADSPPGCVLEDWECVRCTSYIYDNNAITDAQAITYDSQGFEVGIHINTGCADWDSTSLAGNYSSQIAQLYGTHLPGIPVQPTERTHCIAWSDWATQPKVALLNGIRLDTNYYYWPGSWILDRPGMFTGSGMPMRFADLDGTMIDVYQVTTQMTDESGQSYPYHIDTLLDRALGNEQYYGAFCANMHTDTAVHSGSEAIVASAQARGVPVISARQMLTWVDARNASSFGAIEWAGSTLGFDVAKSVSARNLEGMIPRNAGGGSLVSLTRDLASISYRTETIKGVEYALFSAEDGAYEAVYGVDATPPVITALDAVAAGDGTAHVTWITDEPADSRVDYGTDPGTLSQFATDPALVAAHDVVLSGLPPNTTIHYRVTSADAAANPATEPDPPSAPASFVTPSSVCFTDTAVSDFAAGAPDAGIYLAESLDGEVLLAPVEGAEFSGTSLPGGWSDSLWAGGGSVVVAGGSVTLDAGRAGTDSVHAAGRSLEFVATFAATAFQHVGFGTSYNDQPWAMFSTGTAGTGLQARTNNGTTSVNVDLGGSYLGSPHTYRIDWNATDVEFRIDGVSVHTESIVFAVPMRVLLSDYTLGGPSLVVDWVRLTDYAPSGTFESRVYDSGGSANWGVASWTGALPTGTAMSVAVRTGNSPAPDATWSNFDWSQTIVSGGLVGGSSRYAQYRAVLSTTDPRATPVLSDLTIDCNAGPDASPPVISNRTATPGGAGTTAAITWDTDEPADSRVDYGTDPGAMTLNATGGGYVTSHSLGLVGLVPGATYYYRVTSADPSANAATDPASPAPPASFTTPLAACAVDETAADFAGGTPDAGAYLAGTGDGEVTLAPVAGTEFGGTTLDAGWAGFQWSPPAGTATVSGGSVAVDGTRIREAGFRSAGTSLEFVATFPAVAGNAFQHAGFAGGGDASPETFNTFPWAMFSTGSAGTGLLARVWDGGTQFDTAIPGSFLGSPHLYRIDWNPGMMDFLIDGTLVHSEIITITSGDMRAAASDFAENGVALSIDWMRLKPYATSGAYESRVFDGGSSLTWDTMTWDATEPTGTSLVMSARTGETAVPDGTWSPFAAVPASGSALGATGRYLQYRADLATTDATVTPVLDAVTVTCGACAGGVPPAALPALSAVRASSGSPPGEVTHIDLAWPAPAAGEVVSVYRKGFGNYPEYDDEPDAGSEPAVPVSPDAALAEGWTYLTSTPDSVAMDAPPSRDLWYYVAFVSDACGHVSAVSGEMARALDYLPGDVSNGVTFGVGDNAVGAADVAALGGHYGVQEGHPLYEAVLDYGPLATDGGPVTDNRIDFEELVLAAFHYGVTARELRSPPEPAARNTLTLSLPDAWPSIGGTFDAGLWMEGDGSVRGASVELRWDGSIVQPVSASSGELLARQAIPSVLLEPRAGTVDVALLGSGGSGIAGEGWLAKVAFRVVGDGDPAFAFGKVAARDLDNRDVAVGQSVATGIGDLGAPRVTLLRPSAPNPFGGSTRISFDLAVRGRVQLRIYDVSGRLVRTLLDAPHEPGRYVANWDARDHSGRRVGSSVYFCRLDAPGYRKTRKMVLID